MAVDFTNADADSYFWTGVTGLPSTNGVSIACRWYRKDNPASTDLDICGVGNDAGSSGHRMVAFGSTGKLHARTTNTGGTNTSAVSGNSFSAQTEHTGVAVFATSSSRTIYLDGDVANKGTGSSNFTVSGINRICMGGHARSGAPGTISHNGRASEMAVWAAALDDDEARAYGLYGVSPLMIRPSALIFYVPAWKVTPFCIFNGAPTSTSGTPEDAPHPTNLMYVYRRGLLVPSSAAPPPPPPPPPPAPPTVTGGTLSPRTGIFSGVL